MYVFTNFNSVRIYFSFVEIFKKKGSFIGNHKVNLVYFPQWCGKPWSSHCESNKLWSSCVYVTVYYPSLWLYFQCVITSVILQLSHTLFIKVITFVTKLWNFLSKYVHITFLFTNQQILGNHFFSKAPHFRKKMDNLSTYYFSLKKVWTTAVVSN